MLGSKILPTILTLLSAAGASASAAGVAERGDVVLVERDQSCAYTCGSNCYQQKDIDQAVKTGYGLHQQSQTLGKRPPATAVLPSLVLSLKNSSSKYPHQYKNFENFNFPSSAPWYEFPILSSAKIYTGGAPGADRVIFDSKGKLDSLITHSGAKGNNFVSCVQGKQQDNKPDDSKSGAARELLGSGSGGLLAVAAALTGLALA
ncbi:extracellular guanyl-specific ribonuclease RntA [Apiospora marii]|uniref:ribonuclease T1 n=1 Tax=Apiospora marii TaxID=335849 RepID=A0ABR1RLJ3_9PEZI